VDRLLVFEIVLGQHPGLIENLGEGFVSLRYLHVCEGHEVLGEAEFLRFDSLN
jgi:hypothetical protein